MLDYLLVPLTAFFLGVARGSIVCTVFCAPGLIPYVIERKGGIKEALWIGILFNIPRVLVMTIAGALFGVIIYLIGKQLLENIVGNLHIWAYLFFGFFISIIGIRMFYSARKEIMIEKHNCNSCKSARIKPKRIKKKGNALFFAWGSILSLACLGEMFFIEGIAITTASSFTAQSVLWGGLLGGFSMAMFGLGASLPIMVVVLLSAKIGTVIKTPDVIRKVKVVGGVTLVVLGFRLILDYSGIAIALLASLGN